MGDVMDVNAVDHGGAMRPLHNHTSFFPVIDKRAFSAFRKSHGLGARVVRCLGAVNPCQASLVVCAAAGLRSMMGHYAFTRGLPQGQAGKGGAYAI